MQHNVVETVLGAIVLLVALVFLGWAYTRSDAGDPGGYILTARFERVDGLEIGADVRISGIKVGRVLAQELDSDTYRARVRFSVRDGVQLPSDSSAAIVSASLLGGKYLAVVPGGDDRMLRGGEEITLTQSSVNIEDLIGRYIFNSTGNSSGEAATGSAPAGSGASEPGTAAKPQ